MRISLLQTDIKWSDAAYNRVHASQVADKSPSADLYILPEMFTTGFCTEPNLAAEQAQGASLEWMQEFATTRNAAIAGSIAVQDPTGKYFNRFYFVWPSGKYTHYDKHHLFSFSGEDKHYSAGDSRIIVDYLGIRILLLVCYDLRFPVWSRNLGDYDMIIYVASWPTVRIGAWDALLRARAIENLCYVAGVNRVGKDPYCAYNGSSAVIDFLGQTIADAPMDQECTILAKIDIEPLKAFRQKFPALNDADKFSILK